MRLPTTRVQLSFLMVLFAIAPAWADEPAGPLDVYLLIGQSNMAGRAPFTEAEAGPIPGTFLLNGDDVWEPAKNPLNRYSTIRKELGMQKMGPGYGFALAMHEHVPEARIGLVVNAKGGTSIRLWEKGTEFYNEAVRRTRIAQKSGTLKGILWHQGEADRTDPNYVKRLEKFIADLRADLNAPDVPFIAGEIHDMPDFNARLRQLPAFVPVSGCASAEGLTTSDRWHFDAPSMKTLGQRYAEVMLDVQGRAREN